MRTFLILAALMAPSIAAAQPAPVKGPWIDWAELSRRAETTRPAPAPQRSEADARSLGDRVGRMVAAGDCRGGERLAAEARDSALVRAVREYCMR